MPLPHLLTYEKRNNIVWIIPDCLLVDVITASTVIITQTMMHCISYIHAYHPLQLLISNHNNYQHYTLLVHQCHLTFALPLNRLLYCSACLFALGNRLFVQIAGRGMSASVWKWSVIDPCLICCTKSYFYVHNSIAVTYDLYNQQ